MPVYISILCYNYFYSLIEKSHLFRGILYTSLDMYYMYISEGTCSRGVYIMQMLI